MNKASFNLHVKQHSIRTSIYATYIARYMDMSEEGVEGVALAALYHDIGKFAIPERIILKKQLNEKEWDTIRSHTDNGYRMLSRPELKAVARYHHERWDGDGYPDGLKGNWIPFTARIVAIADVFDALVSPRCYKMEMAAGKALLIIAENAGKHFDPEIVFAFFKIVDLILYTLKKLKADYAYN